ncbi:hypothetical protein BCY88_07090 [Paraburkholderia fungorum]|uniref:Uncharacterized protein n=1 Tax=Paraburkholderia fungorum TaxID=134537 RepID=A0A3R7E4C1_9BURK|nr:hypothetical protein BCY88_07090 [Paraburkholderia fungorum]
MADMGAFSRQDYGLRNQISILWTADILLLRDFENLFAKLVKGAQHRPLVGPNVGLQISEHGVVDHEGDFARIVVPPEAHAMPGGVVATAGVGELKHGDQLFSDPAE